MTADNSLLTTLIAKNYEKNDNTSMKSSLIASCHLVVACTVLAAVKVFCFTMTKANTVIVIAIEVHVCIYDAETSQQALR